MNETQPVTPTLNHNSRDQIVQKLISEKSQFIGSYKSMCFYGEDNWEAIYSVIQQNYISNIPDDEYPIVAYATNYPEYTTSSGISTLLFTEYFGKSGFLYTTKNLYFMRSNQKICLPLEQIVQINVKKGFFSNKYIITMKSGMAYSLGAELDYTVIKSLSGVMSKILYTILAKSV